MDCEIPPRAEPHCLPLQDIDVGRPLVNLKFSGYRIILLCSESTSRIARDPVAGPVLDMRHGQERDKYNHRFSRVFYLIPPNAMLMVVCCCCSFWLLWMCSMAITGGEFTLLCLLPHHLGSQISLRLFYWGADDDNKDWTTPKIPQVGTRDTRITLGVGEMCRGRCTPFGLGFRRPTPKEVKMRQRTLAARGLLSRPWLSHHHHHHHGIQSPVNT